MRPPQAEALEVGAAAGAVGEAPVRRHGDAGAAQRARAEEQAARTPRGAEAEPVERRVGGRQHRDVPFALRLEDRALGETVRVEGAVAVEVVGEEVGDHRDVGAEAQARQLVELERGELEDDRVLRAHAGELVE